MDICWTYLHIKVSRKSTNSQKLLISTKETALFSYTTVSFASFFCLYVFQFQTQIEFKGNILNNEVGYCELVIRGRGKQSKKCLLSFLLSASWKWMVWKAIHHYLCYWEVTTAVATKVVTSKEQSIMTRIWKPLLLLPLSCLQKTVRLDRTGGVDWWWRWNQFDIDVNSYKSRCRVITLRLRLYNQNVTKEQRNQYQINIAG